MRIIFARFEIFQIVALGLAFLCLVVGQASPDDYGRLRVVGIPLNPIIFVVSGLFAVLRWREILCVGRILLPCMVGVSFTALMVSPSEVGWSKSLNLIVAVLVSAGLIAATHPSRDTFWRSLSWLCALFLLIALFKKSGAAFLDSNVRYGLFGPTVFGRLMAMGALASLFCCGRSRLEQWILLPAFLLATAWSFARAPQGALVITLLFLAVTNFASIPRRFTVGASVVLLSAVAAMALTVHEAAGKLHEMATISGDPSNLPYEENRARVSEKIFSQYFDSVPRCLEARPCVSLPDTPENWIRPVHQREMAWRLSADLLTQPGVALHGIGLGRWGELIDIYEMGYPHNLILEALVEMGLIAGLIFLFPFFRFFARLGEPASAVAMMFLICQMAGGDMLDARYSLLFAVLATMSVPSNDEINPRSFEPSRTSS